MSNLQQDLQIIKSQLSNLSKNYKCLYKFVQDNSGSEEVGVKSINSLTPNPTGDISVSLQSVVDAGNTSTKSIKIGTTEYKSGGINNVTIPASKTGEVAVLSDITLKTVNNITPTSGNINIPLNFVPLSGTTVLNGVLTANRTFSDSDYTMNSLVQKNYIDSKFSNSRISIYVTENGLRGEENYSTMDLSDDNLYAQRSYAKDPNTLIEALTMANEEQMTQIKTFLGIV